MRSAHVDRLNRRLGDSLGMVNGGTLPRFSWRWAPDEPHFVYDLDDRTLLRRSWADRPGVDGKPIGRCWVLAEWRVNKTFDHCGYGAGMRVPVVKSAKYSPYFETALSPGEEPDERLNQNYIWALDKQLRASVEHNPYAMQDALANERFEDEHTGAAQARDWREQALAGYDQHVGAFGNCTPGTAGGFLSFGGL